MRAASIEPNVFSWNAILSAHVRNEEHRDNTFDVLDKLKERGVTPDMATYAVIIALAARMKQYKAAVKLFDEAKMLGKPSLPVWTGE